MSNSKTRNGAIDLLRLFFCFGIVLAHSDYVLPEGASLMLPRAALCVEYFFLVSGYLMVCSADAYLTGGGPKLSTGMATSRFMKRKINSLMPVIVIAPILSFIVVQTSKRATLVSFLKKSLLEIWRPLLLQEAGFGNTSELWYISALLLVMLALYPVLIRHFDMFVRVIAPLLGIFTIGWLCKNEGSLLSPSSYLGGIVYKGLVRAVGEICIGAAIYPAVQYLKSLTLTKTAKCTITLFECGCIAFSVFLMRHTNGLYDFFVLLLLTLLVTFVFSHQGILSDVMDNDFFTFCGKFSLYLYLCHNWIGKAVGNYYNYFVKQGKYGLGVDLIADHNRNLLIYFCGVMAATFTVFFFCEFLKRHSGQIFGFFKKIFLKSPAPAQV